MYKNIRQAYKLLTAEKKNEFISWATERYGVKPMTVKNHWMYGGSVPEERQVEVLAKLEELSK